MGRKRKFTPEICEEMSEKLRMLEQIKIDSSAFEKAGGKIPNISEYRKQWDIEIQEIKDFMEQVPEEVLDEWYASKA